MERTNDNGIFSRDFTVLYSQLDNKYQLSSFAAVNLLQDMAIRHSNSAGYTLDFLKERNKAWLIKGWNIEFLNSITENVNFTISTWTKPLKKLQAERSFVAEDSEGREVFKASSRWFLIDTEKRKPLKIQDAYMSNFLPSDTDSALDDFDYRAFKPIEENIIGKYEKNIVVENSNLDTNLHVNNATYIGWAMDCIPFEDYHNLSLKKLYSVYINEIRKDDKVTAKVIVEKYDSNNVYTINFYDPNSDKQYCQVRLILQ